MIRNYISIILAGLLLTALCGCGSSNSGAPAFLGTHPAGWENPLQHGMQYVLTPEQCTECHGKDLLGGISKQSCTPCHHHSPPVGYSDWATAHGVQAKKAPGDMTGYVVCRSCHGESYEGTVLSRNSVGTAVGCLTAGCHNMLVGIGPPAVVVHPPHSGSWNDPYNFIGSSHTTTDPANATACYQCHNRDQGPHIWLDATGNPTVSIPDMLTPSTGNPDPLALPGCFNNTLCHGQKP